ncbi:chromatin-remodeling ATPase INO80 [Trichonephila clavipes]|nr:chromatin-remodeling ATPase INO80 [Trichonephila clavipes]
MASRAETEASINNDHGLLAKPLHLQRLEQAVRLEPFLNYIENVYNESQSDNENIDEGSHSDFDLGSGIFKEKFNYKQERRCDRLRLYNFSKVKKNRVWLKDILLSDSSDSDDSSESITEEDLHDMLKLHKYQKTAQTEFHNNPELRQFQYYGSGLLSNYDKFHDNQKLVLGGKKLKEKKAEKRKVKLKKAKNEGKNSKEEQDSASGSKRGHGRNQKGDDHGDGHVQKHHSRKKSSVSHEAVMNLKRKRLWVAIGKKEIGRAQKQMLAAHKETLTVAKKLALACQREVRKSTLTSQKLVKDIPTRARRLTKEMMLYWKRYEKVEKEHRKRAEKEAQEQLRLDIELREAKRQQRKLNFLITQTELYAHFMSRKVTGLHDVQEEQILRQLDEPKKDPGAPTLTFLKEDENYCPDDMKTLALENANSAYKAHVSKTAEFDSLLPPAVKQEMFTMQNEFDENFKLTNPSIEADEEYPQPAMFVGKLKTYQLKGMNWLYSLYDKGINGILADEMGLGKTVQTIAFLATLIKAQGIWGPFLIIAPASTLHNWQQEFAKFVPKFKVLPYWGNTTDRKVLRKFWSQTDLHTENASFHVLITSYQLVVQDVKYFQRIKWQYMVLDEAQAIKSTSSQRWKILLSFNCRNRLLLTGTPIQNSMAELWALLHFIMPTLFDSHDEFNEWFSKDIESHAENKTVIDEKHLSRLHKILQPFMLRRVKKDVENELSDKIEILVYCPLTRRQKLLYQNLRKKISIDDLMQSSSTVSSHSQSATSSLMNLVMQFRKVCNHPDLFEKREVKSPFFFKSLLYILPKLLYRQGLLFLNNFKNQHISHKMFGIFYPDHIHYNLFPGNAGENDFDISDDENDDLSQDISDDENDDLSQARNFYEIDCNNPSAPPPRFAFTNTPEIHLDFDASSGKMQYYEALIDNNLIVHETNHYAEQTIGSSIPRKHSRSKKWEPTSKEEMPVFIALIILQGIVKKPTNEKYWSKRHSISTPFFSKVMSYRRFNLIYRFLHFSDNETFVTETHECPKLSKIWPVLKYLTIRFKEVVKPDRDVTIDESLMLFKGRLGWKQYMPLKRS